MFFLAQEKEQIDPSSAFIIYAGPQQIRWCPPALMMVIFFT